MHNSFNRLDAVESTSFYYIEVADSYCLTYRLRTEVDSVECVSPVRGSSISESIVEYNICNPFTARNVNFAELEPTENRGHFMVTTDHANLMPRA